MTTRPSLWIQTAFVLGLGCASGAPPAPPAPIQARVSRVFPKTKNLGTSLLSVKVELYNPRSTPVEVGELRYRLATRDVAGLIEGSVVAGAQLAAEQQAEVGFDIEVPLPTDGDALVELMARDSVPVDLTGQVEFGDGTDAAFERKTSLAMPSLPKFVIFDAQAARYGRKGVDLTLLLRLVNENGFTQPVQGVSYTVTVGGQELRSGEAGVGARLTPGGAEEYEESIVLESASELLRTGTIDYRVRGEVKTRELTIPFDHAGAIELAAPSE